VNNSDSSEVPLLSRKIFEPVGISGTLAANAGKPANVVRERTMTAIEL
jgi:hypothetical protein